MDRVSPDGEGGGRKEIPPPDFTVQVIIDVVVVRMVSVEMMEKRKIIFSC